MFIYTAQKNEKMFWNFIYFSNTFINKKFSVKRSRLFFFPFLTSINIKTQTYIKMFLHHNNTDTTLQFYLSDTEK